MQYGYPQVELQNFFSTLDDMRRQLKDSGKNAYEMSEIDDLDYLADLDNLRSDLGHKTEPAYQQHQQEVAEEQFWGDLLSAALPLIVG